MSTIAKVSAFGLFYACCGIIANILIVFDLELDWGLQWLFKLRGTRTVPSDVVVVAIDRKSSEQLSLPLSPKDWPRSMHTSLVRNLTKAGARVIAFDMRFETTRDEENQDEAFAEALREAGNVVILSYLTKEIQTLKTAASRSVETIKVKTKPPIDKFAETASAVAPFPLPKIPVRLSQHWLFIPEAGDIPTLPAVAFHLFAREIYWDVLHPLIIEELKRLGVKSAVMGPNHDVTILIHRLRQLFRTHPNLSQRVVHRLENKRDTLSTSSLRLLKSLIQVYSGPNERFLDFYGPPRTITHIPYYQALENGSGSDKNNNAMSVDFQDKAVFVGFSEQLQEKWDSYYTVFSQPDGSDISGVEVAATSFANLLELRHVKPLPFSLHIAVLTLWGLVLSVLFILLPGLSLVPIVSFFAAAYIWSAHLAFVRYGTWMPLAVPLLFQFPLALLSTLLWRYRMIRKEREKMYKALKHYVPTWVVDELIRTKQQVAEKGKNRYCICLATDAEQYTRLSERLDPERLHSLLNQYYELLFKPVTSRGGFISDVVGDAMLAIWPTDILDQECREKACNAALDIINRIQDFRYSELNSCLPTRIGLHCGEVFLGNVGAGDHFEYRAVGDTVNSSERIENLNKKLGTRILASFEVVEDLEGIVTRNLGHYRLPGKNRSLIIHEIVCLSANIDHDRRQLHTDFELGLDLFQGQKWQEAVSVFESILTKHGGDPPSRYFRDLCVKYISNSPPTWDRVVDID